MARLCERWSVENVCVVDMHGWKGGEVEDGLRLADFSLASWHFRFYHLSLKDTSKYVNKTGKMRSIRSPKLAPVYSSHSGTVQSRRIVQIVNF